VVDGVDGPLRHQLCQNELLQISDKGAVRGPDYPNGMDTSKHIFSCMGLMLPSSGVAQEAAAQPGAVVFCEVAADRYRNGGVWAAHYWARELRKLGHE